MGGVGLNKTFNVLRIARSVWMQLLVDHGITVKRCGNSASKLICCKVLPQPDGSILSGGTVCSAVLRVGMSAEVGLVYISFIFVISREYSLMQILSLLVKVAATDK